MSLGLITRILAWQVLIIMGGLTVFLVTPGPAIAVTLAYEAAIGVSMALVEVRPASRA